MIKLVASDLDGTLLLNGAQSLPEELFPLIRKLKEMGILFVAASGRQYANMLKLFGKVAEDMAFICENGAMTIQNNKVLYQDAFDPELALEIIKAIQAKEGAEYTCSTKDFYYMCPKTEHFSDLMLNVVRNECKTIKSFEEITEPCMKIAVYERGGISEESIRYWRDAFGKYCTVVTSGNDWVDFIPFGTNKAKGLRELQQFYHISPDECIVFGDEYNDIEMLKAVRYSFAMAHSKAGVRACANYETERVEPVLDKIIIKGGNPEEVTACIQKNVL